MQSASYFRAIVMAGGGSTRMRATSGPRHKALTEISGMSLAEWNVRALLASGCSDITVVIGRDEAELAAFSESVLVPIAAQRGAALHIHYELTPLGNAGGAAAVPVRGDTVVVFVDNLTTLDLAAMLDRHRRSGAAMTIATHVEFYRNPFGELTIIDGHVTAYDEKPAHPAHISSGTFILGDRARAAIAPGERIDLATLCARVLGQGYNVAAFEHAAPWIDVNDAAAVARAEALVAEHVDRFAFVR